MTQNSCYLQVLLNDITGQVAKDKEVDAIRSSMKETRVTRSFVSFEVLARVVKFDTNVNSLVTPVINHLLGTFDDLITT